MLPASVTLRETREVYRRCLCLQVQRTARALARRFDTIFRPLGITSGQFSLMMALNRPAPPGMADVAETLAMDRTTLTAALKPLTRRGLVAISSDPSDRRRRLPSLTPLGQQLLAQALPLWRAAHAELDALLPAGPERLRDDLAAITAEAATSAQPTKIP